MLTDEERIQALVCAPINSDLYKQALKEHQELFDARKSGKDGK